MQEWSSDGQKALLVGVDFAQAETHSAEESLHELKRLADTAAAEVVGVLRQKRQRPDAAYYVGRGKAEEIRDMAAELKAEIVIFDQDLLPAQARNLEEITDIAVLDRTQLILDIFAKRAQTKEGKLQVELAQLKYLLPRLIGKGTQLSRLGGGIGTRGPGETKLETDRRRIRKRISDLEKNLIAVKKQRELLRRSRKAVPVPLIALVGYTNAGKSSLLNALTGSEVLVENRLFATLDPTSRQLNLPNNQTVVLTDTVGFIRHLPHHLVAAFRATLEEALEAELLLHVVDYSHPNYAAQVETVNQVLSDLGAGEKPRILVFNKVDALDGEDQGREAAPGEVFVSAVNGQGLEELTATIAKSLAAGRVRETFFVPYGQTELVALLHAQGQVFTEEHLAEGVQLDVELPTVWARRITARLGKTAP